MFTYFRKGKLLWPLLLVSTAFAAQTLTFTITKPPGYIDGTTFGTEQLVYIVYDAATDKQLFSTFSLITTKSDIPDGVKCFYARAGIYDLTNNRVLIGADGKSTLSEKGPNSCTPAVAPVATKQVAPPTLGVK